jgi:hypothetical protein
MHQTPDDLGLIGLTLINNRLTKDEDIFVFASGMMRGKLTSAEYFANILPSQTYLPSNYNAIAASSFMEPCVQLIFVPTPRNPEQLKKVEKLKAWKGSRKPQIFNIPVRVFPKAVFLKKVDNMWMLNIVSTNKGE